MKIQNRVNAFSYCLTSIISLLLLVSILFAFRYKHKPRVLVFSKATGFVHASIPVGNAALVKMGMENDFDVDTTKEAGVFTNNNLRKYSVIIFLSTTEGKEDLLNENQKRAFMKYIHQGGGWVGIHAATDAGYRWPWYGKLSGAYFLSHPQIQQATLNIIDRKHPATKYLPLTWVRTDEWYNFKELNKEVKVLISIDEKSYTGGVNGNSHPMAWYHNYEGGRAFYTALGHSDDSYYDPLFLKHLLGGIRYAMDQNTNAKEGKN